MSYVLSCCSTVDLSMEHLKSRNIEYICFHYYLDEVEHLDDLGQTMSMAEFYATMEAGAMTRTSQVNISEYLEHFCRFLEQGQDVIHLCLSSGISGTYGSAENAARIARERYPDRKLYVIDSLAASSGYGLLMDTLADLRDEGMDIDSLRDWTLQHRLELHHWFFSTDLKYYVRGGRVSKTAGFVGGLLNICPLLNVDAAGCLIPRSKIRTKKKVIQEIVQRMEEHARDGYDYNGKCFISNSACLEDAQAVASLVEQKFPKLNGKVLINDIGTTIGSHTGPGTVALFFWGDERK